MFKFKGLRKLFRSNALTPLESLEKAGLSHDKYAGEQSDYFRIEAGRYGCYLAIPESEWQKIGNDVEVAKTSGRKKVQLLMERYNAQPITETFVCPDDRFVLMDPCEGFPAERRWDREGNLKSVRHAGRNHQEIRRSIDEDGSVFYKHEIFVFNPDNNEVDIPSGYVGDRGNIAGEETKLGRYSYGGSPPETFTGRLTDTDLITSYEDFDGPVDIPDDVLLELESAHQEPQQQPSLSSDRKFNM